jgi:uncharacterized protein YbbC (DUF1343 family)
MLTRLQIVAFGHLISVFFVICQGCAQPSLPAAVKTGGILPGAWVTEAYLPLLKEKRVGLVVNHTSTIRQTHLVDSLVRRNINVVTLFAPEHGFRGQADAGAHIIDGIDSITGVKIISLYGDKKKPSGKDMEGIDVMVFDIQDVGVRFYTYISTLHYIMEACADLDIPLIVLDRPNPNGHYIDGPVMDTTRFQSFVGMHPVPVVYGMTIGELAQMINGEKWIGTKCNLTVIPCGNYDHTKMYELPLRPSPNLPDLRSVLLYPGICFFEGTPLSLGRGTSMPFQVVGHPDYPDHTFSFIPKAMLGAMNPPLKDKTCYGVDLSLADIDSLFRERKLELSVLLHLYKVMDKNTFFNASWFDKLAGTSSFREAIQAGWTEEQIRGSWKEELKKFNERRKMYLLYRDFE